MKKILATILTAALMCAGTAASAEKYERAPMYKTISVMRFTDPYSGEDRITVRICDEEYFDETTQDFLRVAYKDGKRAFVDTNGRTQIPIREIAEALHFTVDWDESEKKVTMTKDDSEIVMYIGNPDITVNGTEIHMDTAPVIANDLTYIPLRYVGEAFGYKIEYDTAEFVTSLG